MFCFCFAMFCLVSFRSVSFRSCGVNVFVQRSRALNDYERRTSNVSSTCSTMWTSNVLNVERFVHRAARREQCERRTSNNFVHSAARCERCERRTSNNFVHRSQGAARRTSNIFVQRSHVPHVANNANKCAARRAWTLNHYVEHSVNTWTLNANKNVQRSQNVPHDVERYCSTWRTFRERCELVFTTLNVFFWGGGDNVLRPYCSKSSWLSAVITTLHSANPLFAANSRISALCLLHLSTLHFVPIDESSITFTHTANRAQHRLRISKIGKVKLWSADGRKWNGK